MDLNGLRTEIDSIDDEILELFVKRMEVCRRVADYKKENDLPILQNGREQQLIERIRSKAPKGLEDGSELLFTEIMDISKNIQQRDVFSKNAHIMEPKLFLPKMARVIACPGTKGSNTELAAMKMFPEKEIRYYDGFDQVFDAVEKKEADFGIIPIQSSTAGNVTETYELMAQRDFYIAETTCVKIEHCLAVKKGTSFMDITKVYSHPQALAQCSDFLRENSLVTKESLNTSLAAVKVAQSKEPCACICNRHCAEINGLEIINGNIANADKNLTRFICISKDFYATENSHIISVCLAIPHRKGSLHRMLTKFALNGLDLVRLANKPLAGTEFEVIFFFDFEGRFDDLKICALMDELKSEFSYFKFLGNYGEIK